MAHVPPLQEIQQRRVFREEYSEQFICASSGPCIQTFDVLVGGINDQEYHFIFHHH